MPTPIHQLSLSAYKLHYTVSVLLVITSCCLIRDCMPRIPLSLLTLHIAVSVLQLSSAA